MINVDRKPGVVLVTDRLDIMPEPPEPPTEPCDGSFCNGTCSNYKPGQGPGED